MPKPEISEKNFVWLTQLIQEQAGIQIKENGVQMLQNRISKRVCELGVNSVEAYCEVIQKDQTGSEIATLIDAVTTNYTSFFRDPRQFEQLAEFFEERLNRSRLNVRVWSAACSTGEELYSIAMVAQETATKLCEPMSRFRLLGTDIANSVLLTAAKGQYRPSNLSGISEERLERFTVPVSCANGGMASQMSDVLKRNVILRRFNLCDSTWNIPDNIDAIFCRNVLLYFDVPTQKKILANALEKLNDGGLLFLGASEPVRKLLPDMELVSPSVFRKARSKVSSHEVAPLQESIR